MRDFIAKYYDEDNAGGIIANCTFDGKRIVVNITSDTKIKSIVWKLSTLRLDERPENKSIVITSLNYPHPYIVITENLIGIELKEAFPKFSLNKSWLRRNPLSIIAIIVGAFTAFILLIYFFLIPFIGDSIAKQMPDEYVLKLGNQMNDSYLSNETVNKEASKTANEFLKSLHFTTDTNIHIYVVKSNVVNAYSLPGNIVVFDSIIKMMKSKEELAALLGHEYGHIINRHTFRTLFRQLGSSITLSLLFGNSNAVGNILINNAQQLGYLKYSRNFEYEADDESFHLMTASHLNPDGIIQLFQRLEESQSISVPEIISSHPDVKERIKNMKLKIASTKFAIQPNIEADSLWLQLNKQL